MLNIDPSERITCESALEHPFVRAFHDPEDEPTGELFAEEQDDIEKFTISEWKSIY